MMRSITLLTAAIAVGSLTGCGLAETGAAAAAGGTSQVEQVHEAKNIEARVKQQLDADYQQAADQRRAAEAASQ